jgi:hypothetical protein
MKTAGQDRLSATVTISLITELKQEEKIPRLAPPALAGRIPVNVATPEVFRGLSDVGYGWTRSGAVIGAAGRYVRLIADVVTNSEASRLVGVNRKTGM